ncbi:BPTI/Kunitz domain-containing protein 4-like [Anneissia japonica]|uniref:BPTI/Kunitz domain-containing protein 4-like n=1 Tax=Anneissia japonica TaxID=1529436 RepID=UPI0014259781|nr:BPTI/Kunitz domain-containing protein 4-like [Anneissia japonica]
MIDKLQVLLVVVTVLGICSSVEDKGNNYVAENIGRPGCMQLPAKCELLCPYGKDVDMNGCPTCSCRDLPKEYQVNFACPMPMCSTRCKFGRKVNDMGCETCTCLKSSTIP